MISHDLLISIIFGVKKFTNFSFLVDISSFMIITDYCGSLVRYCGQRNLVVPDLHFLSRI